MLESVRRALASRGSVVHIASAHDVKRDASLKYVVGADAAASDDNTSAAPVVAQSPREQAKVPPATPACIAPPTLNYNVGRVDIWMLGITIVMGGQYFGWNAGLAAGVGSYAIAFGLVSSAYIALCCCSAEVTGALPFAGGAYGLSRCTLGFFPGFLIGCSDALEYITYVATSVLSFADLIVAAQPSLAGLEPLIWLLFYTSALAIHIVGGRLFWRFNLAIGAVSLAILLLYCCGSLAYVDWPASVGRDPLRSLTGGATGFMKALPTAAWFFVGVEALALASDDMKAPKRVVPVAQVACVSSLFVTGAAVLCITVALPIDGGIAATAAHLAPLNNGFARFTHVSDRVATLLSLPATYATAFGFIWCYGKLIYAMATSKLLPPVLARTSQRFGTPYVALLAGSVVGYAICLGVYWNAHVATYLFSICITCAFLSYAGQCIGYIALKRNYRNIKSSSFQSPFGIAGALYSLTIWLLGVVSIAGFQGNGGVEIGAFSAIAATLAVVYFAHARKRQTFSVQENKVLLVAHVVKFNAHRAAGKKSGGGGGGMSAAATSQSRGSTKSHSRVVAKGIKPSRATGATGRSSAHVSTNHDTN